MVKDTFLTPPPVVRGGALDPLTGVSLAEGMRELDSLSVPCIILVSSAGVEEGKGYSSVAVRVGTTGVAEG